MNEPHRPAGALVARLEDDMFGGDNSPYNYGVWCGGCGALLGRLGTFTERVEADGRKRRKAHCSRCHATTIVEGATPTLLQPACAAGVCVLCSTAPTTQPRNP